jgi:anti-sigma-K factor RskA
VNYLRPDLLDRLASEYVLGTLRGRARRRFEQLIRTQAVARAATREWETRLATLAQSVPAVDPPGRVWQAIDAQLGSGADARRAPPATSASPAVAASGARWLAWWKPALGFAFGAALTVALVQTMPGRFMSVDELAQREQALPQSYVGLLLDAEGQPALLLSSTRHGRVMTVKSLRPLALPSGKVAQVWALPKDGAPFALGAVEPAKPPGRVSFQMADSSERLLSQVPRLAVSFEDAPVPSGASTKPSEFVLSGHCAKLW